ncbi:hypothetical protein LCGC14_2376390, partial [marine sediment metagenome]
MRLREGEIMGKDYRLIVGVKEDGEIVEVSAEKPNRYVTLNGFVDGLVGIKDAFRPVSVRKEMVIKVAMGLLTEHFAEQIRRENEPV